MPSVAPPSNSISNSARSVGNAPADDENTNNDHGSNTPTINDAESLKQGIIKTFQHGVEEPYTILLVGGPGVGKSAVVQFIANVLLGTDINHYDLDILGRTNGPGDSGDQSRTNGAHLYEFKSRNGIVVRILDTPGFAETRNAQQDELHRKGIENQIRELIDSVTDILVLANGTVPRITLGMEGALSTLSNIFPSTLHSNVAFVFTNISNPFSWNFCQDTVPNVLKDARQLKIDNPLALQKRYLELKDDPDLKFKETKMLEEVNFGEQNALNALVDLFDWLDGLHPQQITEEKTRGRLAQVTGFLSKVKLTVQEAVRKIRRIFMGE